MNAASCEHISMVIHLNVEIYMLHRIVCGHPEVHGCAA